MGPAFGTRPLARTGPRPRVCLRESLVMATCDHNMKARRDGLCGPCSVTKPYMTYRLGKSCQTCRDCKECGWFWGAAAPEALQGRRVHAAGGTAP